MPRPPTTPSVWRPVRNSSSQWRHVEDGKGVTVFLYSDAKWTWKWVYDGEFSQEYGSDDEAMAAAEAALDLE